MPITPGPWKYGVRDDDERSIWLSLGAPLSGTHYQVDLVASEADAKLIVAARDLLEAAIIAHALLDSHSRNADRIEEKLRLAIDKAQGK